MASILNATTPIFAIVVGHLLTRDERLAARKAVGVMLGFTGVAVMLGIELLNELGGQAIAQCAVLMAACSYAVAGYLGRRLRAYPPVSVAAGQLTASTCIVVPLALFVDQPWGLAVPSMTTLGAMLALGVLSTALAYVIYFKVLARSGTLNLMLATFLIPVSAILLGVLVLGEVLASQQQVGMIIIGLALIVVDGRLLR